MRIEQFLEDYDQPADAYKAYLEALEKSDAIGDFEASLSLQIIQWAQYQIVRLDNAFADFGRPRDFASTWRPRTLVFVGDAGHRCYIRETASVSIICLDLDLLLRLFLFVFFLGIDDKDDDVYSALAAFLLLSLVVPRSETFPCLKELFDHCSEVNPRLAGELFPKILRFVLFHELGHSYLREHQPLYLRILFDVPVGHPVDAIESIRYHPDGNIYNKIECEGAGAANGILLVKNELSKWRSEFAADIFAAYGVLYTTGNSSPGVSQLDGLAIDLTCWQFVLFAIGSRQSYMSSVSAEVTPEALTHPPAGARVDVLIHHLNYFAEEFAPNWRSADIALFKKHYDALWRGDLLLLLNTATEYVRYAFDEEGQEAKQGRSFTLTGKPIKPRPSALVKLEREFLVPLLQEASRVGWSTVIVERREEHVRWIETFRVNDQPIIRQLGKRLRAVQLRFRSEDIG